MSLLEHIESALINGKMEAAESAAQEYIMSASDSLGNARQVGELLQRLYREFHVENVHAFYEEVLPRFPDSMGKAMREQLEEDINLTFEWNRVLNELANERLSNEILDQVKASNMAAAEECVRGLLDTANSAEDLARRAEQVGFLLGGLVHEKQRARALVDTVARSPQDFGLDSELAEKMRDQFEKSLVAASRRERPTAAVARVQLTQATVELSRSLPGRMEIREPDAEQITRFDKRLRAILRCCLLSYDCGQYHEATLLMVEFSPKELSAAAALAGVEQRLYPNLGRSARMVVSRVFAEIGATKVILDSYSSFAKRNLQARIGRYAVEVLGLFKNAESSPFLIDAMTNRKLAGVRQEAVFALGAIGDDKACRALLQALEADMHGRVIEGEQRRDALALLGALARCSRPLNGAARTRLIAQVLKVVPKEDTELVLRAALTLFVGKLDGIDSVLLQWAARVATLSLWNIDRPELSKSGRQSPLGFRQPLLDLLTRLAPHTLATINETAMERSKIYCGAYLALGELYAKLEDPSALPVLRQLLLNTSLHEDNGPRSAYTREMVFDPTTEEKSEMTKDKVLASLVWAVDKIGGEEAEDILSQMFELVRAKRLPGPGPETADLLMQAHIKSAQRRGVSAFPVQAPPPADAGDGEPMDAQPAKAVVSESDLRLIKDLEASYFFAGKRREKKVGAMAALAQKKIVGALPVIIRHLADKDMIIQAAAISALLDFAAGPTPANVLAQLHSELIQNLETGEPVMRMKAVEVLTKLGPRKSPLKEKLETLASKPDLPLPLRALMGKLVGGAAATPARGGAAVGGASQTPAGGSAVKTAVKAGPSLDKRRAFMLARQEWIRNGKRGPEPKLEDHE